MTEFKVINSFNTMGFFKADMFYTLTAIALFGCSADSLTQA